MFFLAVAIAWLVIGGIVTLVVGMAIEFGMGEDE